MLSKKVRPENSWGPNQFIRVLKRPDKHRIISFVVLFWKLKMCHLHICTSIRFPTVRSFFQSIFFLGSKPHSFSFWIVFCFPLFPGIFLPVILSIARICRAGLLLLLLLTSVKSNKIQLWWNKSNNNDFDYD